MTSKFTNANQVTQAQQMVVQLKKDLAFERIKVSESAKDIVDYCVQNAKKDALLSGIPTSENPFKEKKSCTIL